MTLSEFISCLDPASVLFGVILCAVIVWVLGWLEDIIHGKDDDGPHEVTVHNYLKPEPLDWMQGNLRELTLRRLASLKCFKMRMFVDCKLLSDPEWRRVKAELMRFAYLEVKHGTTATLTQAGSDWIDMLLDGHKQTEINKPYQWWGGS